VVHTCSPNYSGDEAKGSSFKASLGKGSSKILSQKQKDWRLAQVTEHLLSILKVLSSMPSTGKKERKEDRGERTY
jgi:hypothetical protein